MMSPARELAPVTEPDSPELRRLARALDNCAYVRRLLREKEPDLTRLLEHADRIHWCDCRRR